MGPIQGQHPRGPTSQSLSVLLRSLPNISGQSRCLPRAGGGTGREPCAEEPPPDVGAGAAEGAFCPLAGHHRCHHHGQLPAMWTQCGEYTLLPQHLHTSINREREGGQNGGGSECEPWMSDFKTLALEVSTEAVPLNICRTWLVLSSHLCRMG